MVQTLPYGSWPSPITAADVAAGSHPVESASFAADGVWWLERMPAEGARAAVRRLGADGEPTTVLPAPWSVGSRVHEYGGRAWALGADGELYFVERSDQRVWALPKGATEPHPLTPDGRGMRFAELTPAKPSGIGPAIVAVRETHTGARVPARDIVVIPLDGSAADEASALIPLVTGTDFVAYPRLSPDGRRLAWIEWDHPAMPWDATRLRVGDVEDGDVVRSSVLAGDLARASVLQPEWAAPADSSSDRDRRPDLLYATDETGRWNLRRAPGGEAVPPADLAPADADTGGPLWSLGTRWYAPLADGRIVAVRVDGSDQLVVIDPATGAVSPLESPLSARIEIQDASGTRVLVTGAGATEPSGLWIIDVDEPDARLVRSSVDRRPDAAWLSRARALTVDGPHGPVHAFAYPPANPGVRAPDDERPPYLVLVHGGPTGHVGGEASATVAYFTSRGIGVLDVNYGGSTGYGRSYRERLLGQWGVVDRDDVIAAATGIAERGLADPRRLAIRGGSAGGWTVLCALTSSDRFAAGISRYGVADLRALAEDTHDFESRYLDGLVGPLPEAESVYLDRSPLSHLDRFTTPMLIEQGLDDPVVPPAQSEAVRDALAARGIPHAYLPFEGESHGFRRAETIRRSLEAELSFLGQVLGFETPDVPRLELSTGL